MSRSADVPFDAPAVERGVGFFETVLLSGRRAVLWEPHLARLGGTLRRFALPEPDRGTLEALSKSAVEEAKPAPADQRALRLAWIAVSGDLDAPASWRLDISVRAIPEATLERRSGARAVTLPAELRRDTPSVKSTSYFAAVMGLRLARRSGADEALFTSPDGTYLEGTSTSLIAWNGGVLARAAGDALPSVTAAAFLAGEGVNVPVTGELVRSGALLCGSLTLAVPVVSLDGARCAVPAAMAERIGDFNRRLLSDPGYGVVL